MSFADVQSLKALKLAKQAHTIGYGAISGNLFDATKVTAGMTVDANSGVPQKIYSSSSNILLSPWIKAKSWLPYMWTIQVNYGFYDIDQNWISGANNVVAYTIVIAPAGTAYVRFSFNGTAAGRNKELCILTQVGGYKWNSLGDSITENGHLQLFAKRDFTIGTIRNYGVGGTRLADETGSDTSAMVNRYTSMDNDADIVTVMGGTNDWGHDIIISNGNTHDKSTFKGAMRVLIEGLIVKYPGKYIVFSTLPQTKNITYPSGINANGDTTKDFATATKEVCAEYAIPCIDVHNESGINQFTISANGTYTSDGVHPNNAGYQRIAALYVNMFKKIVY